MKELLTAYRRSLDVRPPLPHIEENGEMMLSLRDDAEGLPRDPSSLGFLMTFFDEEPGPWMPNARHLLRGGPRLPIGVALFDILDDAGPLPELLVASVAASVRAPSAHADALAAELLKDGGAGVLLIAVGPKSTDARLFPFDSVPVPKLKAVHDRFAQMQIVLLLGDSHQRTLWEARW